MSLGARLKGQRQQVRLRPTSGRSPGDQGCTRARRVSDGAPSGGALCSSGLNLLAKLELVHLRIVGGALASEACERGDRGGAKARSRRSRSRVGGSELGRRGWWRGHRSIRRAACALLQKPRLGRAVVTAGGRIPPSITPARPSGRRPSRDEGPCARRRTPRARTVKMTGNLNTGFTSIRA